MAGMSAKKATSMGAICTLVCCLICCGLPGIAGMWLLSSVFGEWPTVDGTVVSTRVCHMGGSGNGSSDPTYHATFNYTTMEGVAITSETDYCFSPVPSVGEVMPISYDPDDPYSMVDESVLDIGLAASKTATGIGFGIGTLALCVAVFMCTRPDPLANNSPETYQANAYPANNTYDHQQQQQHTTPYSNNNYGNSSVPMSGPAGDIPTPNTQYGKASGPAGDIPTPMATAVPLTPANVYNDASTVPVSSGPATYYK
ncbi:MAG: hypothetical protein SGBAC_001797 [Bacillariaceae sp.]